MGNVIPFNPYVLRISTCSPHVLVTNFSTQSPTPTTNALYSIGKRRVAPTSALGSYMPQELNPKL